MPSSGSGSLTPITPPSPAPETLVIGSLRQFPVLALETWRAAISYNPWHFWGMSGSLAPVTSACNSIVKQYAWQATDAAGRSEIVQAILDAEAKMASRLGYYPAPHFTSETIEFPRYPDNRVTRLGYAGGDGRWLAVQLKEGHIRAVGVETRSLLGTVAVAYSDADSDGLRDTFTATIATSVTDPDQIAVYIAATDRLNSDAVSEKYRVPASVTISNGTATIKGRAWVLAKPVLYEGVGAAGLDPAETANYVTSLEVYRRYCDPTGITNDTAQALLAWETEPYPAWVNCCTDNSADPAALGYALARVGIRNAGSGIVYLGEAVYNAVTGVWEAVDWSTCRPPDRVTIRYQAGAALVNGEMDNRLRSALVKLAAAELARRICACDSANRELFRWQVDLGEPSEGQSIVIEPGDLSNPFGTRRGHLEAWRAVKQLMNVQGFAVV
jgi:hypothetical protein